MIFYNRRIFNSLRDLPLIMYASSGGGGGVNTNAYKYVQGGRGGSGLLKNATISEPFKKMIGITFKEDQCPTYHDLDIHNKFNVFFYKSVLILN